MVRWKGEGADRRRWRIQGGGRSKNNEQTRGHLCRRSMRHCFFGQNPPGSSPLYSVHIKQKRHPIGCRFHGALEGTLRLLRLRLAYSLAIAAAQALAAKNSVPHCFLHAATLSGSRPLNCKQKSQHPNGYWLLWCAGRDSNP